VSTTEKILLIEKVLNMFARAAKMLRRLDDEYINRVVVSELEGRTGGWKTAADVLRDTVDMLSETEKLEAGEVSNERSPANP
jgi:hypothetical protein